MCSVGSVGYCLLQLCNNFGVHVVQLVAGMMSSNEEGYVVRIRGLPWACTQEEVASFFSG